MLACSAKSYRTRRASHTPSRHLSLDNVVFKSIELKFVQQFIPSRRNRPYSPSRQVPLNLQDSPELSAWGGHRIQVIFDENRPWRTQNLPIAPGRMKSFVQFLTTPSSDTAGTALLLHFDDKRYIIGNIHEGTQRALIQRGTKLLKVSDIFLTGKTEWRTNGGLIGMILTLADAAKAAKDAAIVAKELKSSKLMDQPQKDHPQNEPKNNTTSNEAKSRRLERQTLTIHGGPNVTHTLATARRFVFRKGMPVDVNEIEETCGEQTSPTWADQNIKVWAMSINPSSSMRNSLSGETPSPGKRSFDEFQEKSVRNTVIDDERSISQTATTNEEDRNQQLRRGVVSDMFDSNWRLDALVEIPIALVNMPAALFVRNPNTHKIEKYIGPLPGGQDPLPDINVLVRRAWPGSLVTQLPPTKPSQTSLSYIIRNHHQRGKFLPSKAKALNVEEGEKYRKLTMGIPVMSTDGKIVHPEEVLEPGRPGRGFAVIELPSRDYVYELVNRPEWRASEIMEGVEAFIWILGSGVGEDQTLIEFMNRFKNQKHIISSQDYCPNMLSMDSAAAAAIRHHQIDPTRYPVPIHSNTSSFPTKDLDSPYLSTPNFSIASRGLTIKLEPSVVVQEENIEAPLNTAAVIKATSKDVLILAKAIQLEIASEENQKTIEEQNLPSPDAEIICLGTGSALPSKYRNVSATLLRVPGSGSYLLDCGENTLGQLRRIYSPEELVEVLRDLKMIWISHLHADHHLGTVSVIKAWYQAVYGKDYDPQAEPNLTLTEQPTDLFKKIKEQRCLFVASDLAMLNFLKEYASVEDYGYDKIVGLRVYGAKPEQPGTTSIQWNKMPVSFKDISPFSHDL